MRRQLADSVRNLCQHVYFLPYVLQGTDVRTHLGRAWYSGHVSTYHEVETGTSKDTTNW